MRTRDSFDQNGEGVCPNCFLAFFLPMENSCWYTCPSRFANHLVAFSAEMWTPIFKKHLLYKKICLQTVLGLLHHFVPCFPTAG